MKTTSKLLSMLLLVAMCLSLMGGSAYALDELAPLDDQASFTGIPSLGGAGGDAGLGALPALGEEEILSDPEVLNDIELYTAGDLCWKASNGKVYATLTEAAAFGGTVTLLCDVDINEVTEVAKSVNIDLNGFTLTLYSDVNFNANATIKNGTLNSYGGCAVASNGRVITVEKVTSRFEYFATTGNGKIQIRSGVIGGDVNYDFIDKNSEYLEGGTVGPKGSVYVAYVNDKGFATADEAFGYAAGLTGKVTINFPNDTSVVGNISFSGASIENATSLTINLNDNCLEGGAGATLYLGKVPTTINGYKVIGNINGTNSNITLGSNTSIEGEVALYGGSLKVNGGSVDNVFLSNAALNMSSGTVGNLLANDGTVTLNVSGGLIDGVSLGSASFARAITGGKWNISDAQATELGSAVANNYEFVAGNPYYTVRKIGSSSGGGDTGSDGDFSYTWYGSPYTKNNDETLYAVISDVSENGYWLSRNSNASGAWQLKDSQYDVVSYGSSYELTLKNSYLDTLASGTYYGFVVYNGVTTRMGSFVIDGNNNGTVNPGDVAVWPVNENTWYSGDPMLAFNYRPAINDAGIEVDGWTVPGVDYVNNWMGTLKLGTSYLSNLSRGWHTLTINTDSGRASCDFYIGATLKPVDTDKHVTGSSKNLQFVCTDPISRVWVGGRELTNSDYSEYFTLSSSRKTITLTAKFLNNRTAGETYTLTVQTDNGDTPSCTFQILTRAQASSSPRTGDESNLALWAAVMVLSGCAAVAVLPRFKKHEN